MVLHAVSKGVHSRNPVVYSSEEHFFTLFAAAFVRGRLTPTADRESLWNRPIDTLTPSEREAVIQFGLAETLRLKKFKRTMELPRVRKVLGILRGLAPANLLDIGSGRGTFLFPCLDAFPHLPITAIDTSEQRVSDFQSLHNGGIERLGATKMDVSTLDFGDRTFDVVTFLEVLEHLPHPQQAIAEVRRVAQRFVVISVPSKPDNNPEHIHLFSAADLQHLLTQSGFERVQFEAVHNHLIAIAKVGS